MCGYCIESAVVLDFIQNEKDGAYANLENNWVSIYLQECCDLQYAVEKLGEFPGFQGAIDVAFCRVWESLVNNERGDFYKSIEQYFDAELIDEFLIKIQSHEIANFLPIGNKRLYTDYAYWEEFVGNSEPLIAESKKILESYHKWWVKGMEKEISDPNKRLEETGVMDPIENTTLQDWDNFYSLFPIVYFAFLILSKYQKDSEIIRGCPKTTFRLKIHNYSICIGFGYQ